MSEIGKRLLQQLAQQQAGDRWEQQMREAREIMWETHNARLREEQAAEERRREEWRREKEAAQPQLHTDLAWLQSPERDPITRAMVAHHRPDEYDPDGCAGCDPGSYAEDAPEWPCSTIEALMKAHNLESAELLHYYDPKYGE